MSTFDLCWRDAENEILNIHKVTAPSLRSALNLARDYLEQEPLLSCVAVTLSIVSAPYPGPDGKGRGE
jgi:hypothetical protein